MPREARGSRRTGFMVRQPLEHAPLSRISARLLSDLSSLQELADPKAPSLVYYLTLFQTFKDLGHELDEDRIVKSATGIRNTMVWKKLYKFQRDGVVGDRQTERLGGCIIADSVGLGKTFEALAIIKYYELRNDRVLVLARSGCATTGRSTRPTIAATSSPATASTTTFSTTPICRATAGSSGDIDLAHVNWGNYDLVVIDESHNFRNKATHKDARDPLRPPDAADYQGGREDQGPDAFGYAGE